MPTTTVIPVALPNWYFLPFPELNEQRLGREENERHMYGPAWLNSLAVCVVELDWISHLIPLQKHSLCQEPLLEISLDFVALVLTKGKICEAQF